MTERTRTTQNHALIIKFVRCFPIPFLLFPLMCWVATNEIFPLHTINAATWFHFLQQERNRITLIPQLYNTICLSVGVCSQSREDLFPFAYPSLLIILTSFNKLAVLTLHAISNSQMHNCLAYRTE